MRNEIVRVDPETASRWLAHPFNRQRRVTESRMKTYSRAMTEGRWLSPTLDPIAFTPSGELLNGQHRLRAVIDAGVTVEMLVAFDVDPGMFAVIDTPLGRRAAQFVRTPSAAHVTTTARHVLWYQERWPTVPRGGSSLSFDNDVLLAFIDAHEDELVRAVRDNEGPRSNAGIPHNSGATVLYIAREMGADEARVAAWVEGLSTGADLAANDPRLLLRNRMLTDPHARRDRGEAWQLTVRAFNAWIQNRTIETLLYQPDAEPPRVFLTEREYMNWLNRKSRRTVINRRNFPSPDEVPAAAL